MSRSRRKTPIISDYSRYGTRFFKNLAARTVRRYKYEIPDGSGFKKLYPSWNIHDYVWFAEVSEEHIKHPERNPDEYYGTTHKDMDEYYRK